MAFPSTFLSLQTAVIAKQRLDSTNDLSKVKDWINTAYAQACLETEFFENDGGSTATLAANDSSVAYPTALIILDRIAVAFGGQAYAPMEEVTLDEILRLREGTSRAAGPPEKYTVQYQTIEFWPNATGGEVLTFYGAKLPTALSGDTDTPILPEPFASKLLEYGALAEAADFKKDPDVMEYRSLYEDWLRRLRAHVNRRRGGQTMQLEVVGMRNFPPHDPSTDTGC